MKAEFSIEFKSIFDSNAKRYEITKKEKDEAIKLCDSGKID
jgi:hypothetical protein